MFFCMMMVEWVVFMVELSKNVKLDNVNANGHICNSPFLNAFLTLICLCPFTSVHSIKSASMHLVVAKVFSTVNACALITSPAICLL